ncbi:SDR family NAD(P)-dependent oxidoreductase [Novosphingobium sp. JCM 18896]|uniref:SDR family NAD(P)-dependent oxidoreductase n=1 Tax=Novosphingobium sp. JCM 18896 TaxID=2989731 RepID=UPI0022229CF0|nr:SDR family NAD(P)-dependent oxidoreductase [Novosphingobium sp. JCM 18896]MCW1429067.1 SDR family NAD(P)-dependent oxidoreductase [Novosphingobium sp. JCM 18896]
MPAKTWMITGCSTGFGRALAEALIARGERVVATARRPGTLKSLVDQAPEQVLALELDITLADRIDAAVAAANARFGAIDVLVNNAGFGGLGTVEDASLEAARDMFETNVFGTLAMTKAVLPEMIARRSGQIVMIGSVAGQIGFPALAHYSASKFALAGLTESLAAEVAPLGVAVTLAELGPFATHFTQSMGMTTPSAHYDLGALSVEAGNSQWGAGDDPKDGAAALLAALDAPSPPRRLILGQPGLDVVALHEGRRMAERERWLATSQLQMKA